MNTLPKLKITISSYDDLKNPYFAGGGAIAVHQISKRLAKFHDVTVYTGKYPNCQDEFCDGVIYRRVGISFLGPQFGQFAFQAFLPFLVMTANYDIWLESFTPPFSTDLLPLFTKKPVIGVVHMLSGEDMKRKYKLPFNLIENIGLKYYKYLIVTSQNIQEKILSVNPRAKIAVIPNGIEKIPSLKPSPKKYLLFIGRIELNQKGLDLLLQAYSKVINQIKYPLYIAGSGENKQEKKLLALISSLRLSKQVKYLGRVNGLKKRQTYRNSLLVIIPSRFETFSMVALEAMSYGKALITFAIDGLKWIPQNSRIIVKPFDINALGKAMVKLVFNHTLADNMGLSSRNYVKKFTWDNLAISYQSFITNVIKEYRYE